MHWQAISPSTSDWRRTSGNEKQVLNGLYGILRFQISDFSPVHVNASTLKTPVPFSNSSKSSPFVYLLCEFLCTARCSIVKAMIECISRPNSCGLFCLHCRFYSSSFCRSLFVLSFSLRRQLYANKACVRSCAHAIYVQDMQFSKQ